MRISLVSRKKNMKVVNSILWKDINLSQLRKTNKQNLLTERPGVRGKAKEAKTILDTWHCLINEQLIDHITKCTNK